MAMTDTTKPPNSSGSASVPVPAAPSPSRQSAVYHTVMCHFGELEVPVKFPDHEPYRSQELGAQIIIDTVCRKESMVLVSPTGTGKTLGVLAPLIALQNVLKPASGVQAQIAEAERQVERVSANGSAIEITKAKQELARLKASALLSKAPRPSFRIIYATRTHMQIHQVSQAVRSIAGTSLMVVPLASRQHLCALSRIRNGSDVNAACARAVMNARNGPRGGCKFRRGQAPSKDTELRAIRGCVGDVEDFRETCAPMGVCPYSASRQLAMTADIICLPYNYLIDPIIREQCFGGMGDMSNAVIVLDEAHNIPDALCSSMTFSAGLDFLGVAANEYFSLETLVAQNPGKFAASKDDPPPYALGFRVIGDLLLELQTSIRRLPRVTDHREAGRISFSCHQLQEGHMRVVEKYRARLEAAICRYYNSDDVDSASQGSHTQCDTSLSGVVDFLYDINAQFARRIDATQGATAEVTSPETLPILLATQVLLKVLSFTLMRWEGMPYPFSVAHFETLDDSLLTTTIGSSGTSQSFTISCTEPAAPYRLLRRCVSSIILTSGTLPELAQIQATYRDSFNYLNAGHVIAPRQLFLRIVGSSQVMGNTQNFCLTHEAKENSVAPIMGVLTGLVNCLPPGHGCIAFFSSYHFLDLVSRRRSKKTSNIFIDQKGAHKVDEYRRFIAQGKKPGALFTVFRGSASEGLNFNSDEARLVVLVGIPNANIGDPLLQMRLTAIEKDRGAPKREEYYRSLGMQASAQAAGRVIRHAADVGALILLDQRWVSQYRGLPGWMSAMAVASTNQPIVASRVQSDFQRWCAQWAKEKWQPDPSTLPEAAGKQRVAVEYIRRPGPGVTTSLVPRVPGPPRIPGPPVPLAQAPIMPPPVPAPEPITVAPMESSLPATLPEKLTSDSQETLVESYSESAASVSPKPSNASPLCTPPQSSVPGSVVVVDFGLHSDTDEPSARTDDLISDYEKRVPELAPQPEPVPAAEAESTPEPEQPAPAAGSARPPPPEMPSYSFQGSTLHAAPNYVSVVAIRTEDGVNTYREGQPSDAEPQLTLDLPAMEWAEDPQYGRLCLCTAQSLCKWVEFEAAFRAIPMAPFPFDVNSTLQFFDEELEQFRKKLDETNAKLGDYRINCESPADLDEAFAQFIRNEKCVNENWYPTAKGLLTLRYYTSRGGGENLERIRLVRDFYRDARVINSRTAAEREEIARAGGIVVPLMPFGFDGDMAIFGRTARDLLASVPVTPQLGQRKLFIVTYRARNLLLMASVMGYTRVLPLDPKSQTGDAYNAQMVPVNSDHGLGDIFRMVECKYKDCEGIRDMAHFMGRFWLQLLRQLPSDSLKVEADTICVTSANEQIVLQTSTGRPIWHEAKPTPSSAIFEVECVQEAIDKASRDFVKEYCLEHKLDGDKSLTFAQDVEQRMHTILTGAIRRMLHAEHGDAGKALAILLGSTEGVSVVGIWADQVICLLPDTFDEQVQRSISAQITFGTLHPRFVVRAWPGTVPNKWIGRRSSPFKSSGRS